MKCVVVYVGVMVGCCGLAVCGSLLDVVRGWFARLWCGVVLWGCGVLWLVFGFGVVRGCWWWCRQIRNNTQKHQRKYSDYTKRTPKKPQKAGYFSWSRGCVVVGVVCVLWLVVLWGCECGGVRWASGVWGFLVLIVWAVGFRWWSVRVLVCDGLREVGVVCGRWSAWFFVGAVVVGGGWVWVVCVMGLRVWWLVLCLGCGRLGCVLLVLVCGRWWVLFVCAGYVGALWCCVYVEVVYFVCGIKCAILRL